ncbi:CD40 ligand [Sphaerodactylus townsendi]|uniref:CD40 ligand n=1 Tax=Sphaerodactylus townsendi TaxID=933632 RepID=UPI0020268B8A|nr:CD40 ligand [Sphaerodactylus townsendi]
MDLNEPYSPTTPRPPGTTVTMKTVLYLFTTFVIAQLVGAVLYGLYLHRKMDKVEGEMNLREDLLFLRRLQKCLKPQEADTTLLDCSAILNMFQDLQNRTSKVPQENYIGRLAGKEEKPTASIHLAGFKDSSQPVSVLQWTEALYAPSDDTISHQGGKLKVTRGGRYYVYAQVTFCEKPRSHAPFNVYIYLHLPSERDQLLLKGMRTSGHSDVIGSLQSVHLGRVVELQEGHTIFINVTDSSKVNYDHGNTYFGMFELSKKSL